MLCSSWAVNIRCQYHQTYSYNIAIQSGFLLSLSFFFYLRGSLFHSCAITMLASISLIIQHFWIGVIIYKTIGTHLGIWWSYVWICWWGKFNTGPTFSLYMCVIKISYHRFQYVFPSSRIHIIRLSY